jgi:hypothetical protein
VMPVPGTQIDEICLVVRADLWRAFLELSLWVEALCIHEWCLFSEKIQQEDGQYVDRGLIYRLVTARPDNRRPLTWERNQIDLLLMEGQEFICPWTERQIRKGVRYDIDHVIPVSVYPINELWNLVPADPDFNSHKKRDRLPSAATLARAQPHLVLAYEHYGMSEALAQALHQDVAVRFLRIEDASGDYPKRVAQAVTDFVDQIVASRNPACF